MAIGSDLQKKLNKTFEASSTIEDSFRGNDLTILTNESGEATTVFIGKRRPDGSISGERYSRRIIRDQDGTIIKNHWDNKGKTSGFKR